MSFFYGVETLILLQLWC